MGMDMRRIDHTTVLLCIVAGISRRGSLSLVELLSLVTPVRHFLAPVRRSGQLCNSCTAYGYAVPVVAALPPPGVSTLVYWFHNRI